MNKKNISKTIEVEAVWNIQMKGARSLVIKIASIIAIAVFIYSFYFHILDIGTACEQNTPESVVSAIFINLPIVWLLFELYKRT